MPRRKHHHVYVIELSKDVLLEPRFRKGNPDVRFDKHKAGPLGMGARRPKCQLSRQAT